jgi:hypothetical protein
MNIIILAAEIGALQEQNCNFVKKDCNNFD